MNWQDVFRYAREYQDVYDFLQRTGVNGNIRVEAAKRLNMSTPQADRYGSFNKLLPDVQNMVRDYNVGMSSLLPIATHTHAEQREIYEILQEAWSEGANLTRGLIKRVVDSYREGKKSWFEVKPDCSAFCSGKRAPKRRGINTSTPLLWKILKTYPVQISSIGSQNFCKNTATSV